MRPYDHETSNLFRITPGMGTVNTPRTNAWSYLDAPHKFVIFHELITTGTSTDFLKTTIKMLEITL